MARMPNLCLRRSASMRETTQPWSTCGSSRTFSTVAEARAACHWGRSRSVAVEDFGGAFPPFFFPMSA